MSASIAASLMVVAVALGIVALVVLVLAIGVAILYARAIEQCEDPDEHWAFAPQPSSASWDGDNLLEEP
ncbi:hypothetical protein [Microcystis phage Mae-JY22]